MDNNTFAKIQQTTAMTNFAIESWSGLNCDCYVSLWVSWFFKYIKAGTGMRIGAGEFINLTDHFFEDGIVNFEVSSTSHAYWLFDFAMNSTNGKYVYIMII